jgi:glycerol-3-phosphate dehydrogenase
VTRTFDALCVGGGATGAGLARDLALRGVRCLLVEQGDLCHGTSGRFHGLLHSGARYAVRDPQSARECIHENRIVRRIAAHCVEDTGGLFCWLRGDPEDYPPAFLAGCRESDVDVEEVSPEGAWAAEPLLTRQLARAFRVPDAAVQSFDLVAANARAAEAHGATVQRLTRLARIEVEGGRAVGAELEDVRTGERERVEFGVLVSAAGIWAGVVAGLAGVPLEMSPGWGIMVITNQRLCQAVVNRCRPPSDADIVVPVGTVTIAGTTDRTVEQLEGYEISRQEVRDVLEGSAQLIPALEDERVLRVFAGARPLYDPAHDPAAGRMLSRSHTVLDHAGSGVDNFVSIVGGKLTTYRLMAEHTADAACAKLGVSAPCRTADESLPEAADQRYWWLGGRLERNEEARDGADADLVCECELVTRPVLEAFVERLPGCRLDDMLRGLRLGMGPCQGCFCAVRAAAVREDLQPLGAGALEPLGEFLEERMKGNRPILWGDGARQHRLTEIVYREVFALDHDADAAPSSV